MLTIERLKRLLHYDPDTGVFTYRETRGRCLRGTVSGKRHAGGYWRVSIDRKIYQAHRLAWFYVFEEWPNGDIDHINLDKVDNRISNLRIATPSENQANTSKRTKTLAALKGVTWHKCGKWQASVKVSGRAIYLGLFDTPEAAHIAYCAAAKVAFGKFARAA